MQTTVAAQTQLCLKAALAYRARGFSVIPVGKNKKPLVEWAEYQDRLPTGAEIREWWRRWPGANVAIVTGRVSGVVVLDVDGPEAREALQGRPLPPTPCVLTGKGTHYYFQHPGFQARNFVKKLPGLDFRGDGGYVLAPPSLHPSGRRYRWAEYLSLKDVALAPCPEWLLELIGPAAGQDGAARPVEDWRRLVSEGVAEGARNNSIAALAGHLLRRGVDPYVVLDLLLAWNKQKCRPPLPDEEVVTTVNSVARAEARRRGISSE